jgi:hypothetical protein
MFAMFGSELQKDRRPGEVIKRDGNLYNARAEGAESSATASCARPACKPPPTHPPTTAALALLGGLGRRRRPGQRAAA